MKQRKGRYLSAILSILFGVIPTLLCCLFFMDSLVKENSKLKDMLYLDMTRLNSEMLLMGQTQQDCYTLKAQLGIIEADKNVGGEK